MHNGFIIIMSLLPSANFSVEYIGLPGILPGPQTSFTAAVLLYQLPSDHALMQDYTEGKGHAPMRTAKAGIPSLLDGTQEERE